MIDSHLPASWPIEVMRALDRFKQGHLVARPPFFYVARPEFGVWQFTRDVGDPAIQDDLLQIDPEDGPPYGLIVSQTCDINEQALKPKQPWVQVCPVYRIDTIMDRGRQGHVKKGRMQHLIALDSHTLSEGLWAADLRIEFPVEKSWLVDRAPIEAFSNEDGYLKLADRLAQRRGRPAFANVISDLIVNTLRNRLNTLNSQQQDDILDSIEQFRLEVDGHHLLPASARLLTIFVDGCSEEKQAIVKSWLDAWWQDVQPTTTAQGLPLLANRYGFLDDIPTRIYARSTRLDFAYLSPVEP